MQKSGGAVIRMKDTNIEWIIGDENIKIFPGAIPEQEES